MIANSQSLIRQDARSLQGALADVRLAQRWYAPGVAMPPHMHGDGAISFVLGGSVEEAGKTAIGWQRCDARFGASVIKPAGAVHSNRFGPRGARLISIELSEPATSTSDAATAQLARELLTRPSLYGWSAHHLDALHGLRLLAATARQEDSFELVAAILADLLRRLRLIRRQPSGPSAPAWMSAAMKRLHDSTESRLRVRELGRSLRVHPVSVARGFQRVHGCGVIEYRRRLHVVRAARRLAETLQPLCEVAISCGFADQSHLCRLFRREVGLTPGQFRSFMRTTL